VRDRGKGVEGEENFLRDELETRVGGMVVFVSDSLRSTPSARHSSMFLFWNRETGPKMGMQRIDLMAEALRFGEWLLYSVSLTCQ